MSWPAPVLTSAHAVAEHSVHAAVVVLPVAVLVLSVLRERWRTSPGRERPGRPAAARRVALGATAVAVAGHAALVPGHLVALPGHAAFFAAAAVAQAGTAAAYARRGTPPFRLALGCIHLGLIGLWALTRTRGLPWGQGAGLPEAVGLLDALVVVAELSAVTALLVRAQRRSTGRAGPAQLEPDGLAVAVGEGAPAVGDALHDGHPAPRLTVV